MSKLREELELRLFSFLAWALIHVIGHTSRFRVAGYEHVQELLRAGRGFILAVWHGRTLMPIYHCRGMGIWAIVSPSRDGELQARIISRLGYRIIRGSSARGGIKAALAAAKKLREGGILAITPDGPRGPANEIQEGAVFLAQRAGCPVIPIGVGVRPRKLVRSWDSYALPAPFAKCALVFGEPILFTKGDAASSMPEDTLKAALDDLQRQAQIMVKEGW